MGWLLCECAECEWVGYCVECREEDAQEQARRSKNLKTCKKKKKKLEIKNMKYRSRGYGEGRNMEN